MTQLQMASWNASVSVWQRNGGNSVRTGGSLANCANARICKRLRLTLDGDQAGEKLYLRFIFNVKLLCELQRNQR